jgi:hypothetical protein
MSLKKSKDAYGRVNTENIQGAKVPRKSGVSDETGGKGLGTRDVRQVGGRFARFAGEDRS